MTADRCDSAMPMPHVQLNLEADIATSVFVTMASKEMDLFHVKILMSAETMCTIAVFMHAAITLLVPMIVLASKDSMEMASHVRILMSAKTISTIAVFMHSAITLLVPMNVLASKDSMEMESHVRMLMNAKVICTIAVFMHSATTLSATMTVTVTQVS